MLTHCNGSELLVLSIQRKNETILSTKSELKDGLHESTRCSYMLE